MGTILVSSICLIAGTSMQSPSDDRSDPFRGALPVVHFDFEEDQDKDFDKQPDDWTRRRGSKFPSYVKAEIDRNYAHSGKQSLRIDVNGGMATYYSQVVEIDSLHSYVFRGFLRTQNLKHNAAVISLSFLDHSRKRVGRVLSKPVSGTHSGWVKVQLGPISIETNTRFVVIGCHLLQGKNFLKDIRGTVWFDDIRMGRLPTLSIVNNFHAHLKRTNSPIEIKSFVSGIDRQKVYALNLSILDSNNREIEKKRFSIEPIPVSKSFDQTAKEKKPLQFPWNLPPQRHGFYQVRASLEREKEIILEKRTSFAVIDLTTNDMEGGFGWSISSDMPNLDLKEFADIASQAGINWVKVSVWKSVYGESSHSPVEIAELFDTLSQRRITGVAVLSDPPAELRNQFARDWSGISEIFTMPKKFWWTSLEPVVARYGSRLSYWQLGSDVDSSFAGMTKLAKVLAPVKNQFDMIGRNTQFVLRWNRKVPLPPSTGLEYVAFPIPDREEIPEEETKKKTKISKKPKPKKIPKPQQNRQFDWIHLKPLSSKTDNPDYPQIAADLVKRMVKAKKNGAKVIFATDIFHEKHGLLHTDGSPTPLFLPWRTAAVTLQGAEYLGSFRLPQGSENHAFLKNDEVILVVWNSVPTTENFFLGEEAVIYDLWGREKSLLTGTDFKNQKLEVGPVPIIVKKCSKMVAEFRLSVDFQLGILKSQKEAQRDVLRARNSFHREVRGQVKFQLPQAWEIELPSNGEFSIDGGKMLNMPLLLSLPSNSNLGTIPITIDFELDSNRFSVYRTLRIGVGDVGMNIKWFHLDDGRLKIDQEITNNTTPVEILNFRCSLYIPGQRRRKTLLTKLGHGKGTKTYYLSSYNSLIGKRILVRAEQMNGKKVLNFSWILTKNELKKPPKKPKKLKR